MEKATHFATVARQENGRRKAPGKSKDPVNFGQVFGAGDWGGGREEAGRGLSYSQSHAPNLRRC